MSKNAGIKTILVAGGAGFVGGHLCHFFVEQGHNVVCLDNLVTGNKHNIKSSIGQKNFKFAKGDVTNFFLNLPEVWGKRSSINEIYHLASPASPVHYQKDPIATFKSNVMGTLNLLELARKLKATFLFASTSEIYGDPLQHPQKESYWGNVNPVGVRSCYDESKRAGETLCMDYSRQFGVNVKIVRIFNTYGPKMAMEDGRVVSNFIVQALQNKPLTVYGRGEQTRSFQYIDDLVSGLVKMMNSKNFAGPVNLGNPEEYRVKQLAALVIRLTGSKSQLVHRPLPEDDPKQRKPDIALAKAKLLWQPNVSLEAGLTKTIAYFRTLV